MTNHKHSSGAGLSLLWAAKHSVLFVTGRDAPCVPRCAARRVLGGDSGGCERDAHAGHGKRGSDAGVLVGTAMGGHVAHRGMLARGRSLRVTGSNVRATLRQTLFHRESLPSCTC